MQKQQKRSAEIGKAAPQPNKKAKFDVQTPTSTPTGNVLHQTDFKFDVISMLASDISCLGTNIFHLWAEAPPDIWAFAADTSFAIPKMSL